MVEKLTRCHGAAQHRQASGTSVYSLAARYAFFRIPRSTATSDLVKFARVRTASSRPRATSRSSCRVASPARTFERRTKRTVFHFSRFLRDSEYSDTLTADSLREDAVREES